MVSNQVPVKVSEFWKKKAQKYIGDGKQYSSFSRFTDDSYKYLLQLLNEENNK
ncbi:MAG: hypothetical protein OEL81_06960 [Nitrosopumilus sp.]|nr:hypothetical protein [Nitrosopumilus sp.]